MGTRLIGNGLLWWVQDFRPDGKGTVWTRMVQARGGAVCVPNKDNRYLHKDRLAGAVLLGPAEDPEHAGERRAHLAVLGACTEEPLRRGRVSETALPTARLPGPGRREGEHTQS